MGKSGYFCLSFSNLAGSCRVGDVNIYKTVSLLMREIVWISTFFLVFGLLDTFVDIH